METAREVHAAGQAGHALRHAAAFWQCLRQLDANAATCRAALAAASDEALAAPWRFSFGEYLISNSPRSLSFRQMCFNHLVHHTAQLGVYLRLNDIPVPGLYGPSADEQWSPPK